MVVLPMVALLPHLPFLNGKLLAPTTCEFLVGLELDLGRKRGREGEM
jgi:hypothetical protein